MHFPYTIAVTPPTRAELSAAARTWWAWAVGTLIGILGAAFILSQRAQPVPASVAAFLQVSSTPAGAAILVDGRVSGYTPADLALPPGDYHVSIQEAPYVSAPRAIHLQEGATTAFHEDLWLRTPQVERLLPVLPGAATTDFTFLENGALAITLALRPGDERQLWMRDREGTLRRIGPPQAFGPLAVSPDGGQTAYLAPSKSTTPGTFGLGVRLNEVWLTAQDGAEGQRLYAVAPSAGNERLVDLSWAPDRRHLLIISRQQQPDGSLRARFLWLNTGTSDSAPRELLRLPAEVVPSSFAWSPDGRYAACLLRAGQRTALFLVDTADGAFRYLADLGTDAPGPLPFPAVAWSSDSHHLLYAAPAPDRPANGLWPLNASLPLTLFIVDTAAPTGAERLNGALGQAPTWRSDGAILALAQPKKSGPLTLRAVTRSGQTDDLTTLSLTAGILTAVRWDVTHAQALVAVRSSGGLNLSFDQGANQLQYWLVRFRTDEREVGK